MMRELVLSGNALTKIMLQGLASKIATHSGLFDSHSLFADMFANPANYLNGTVPFNVTGAVNTCVFQVGNSNENVCTLVGGTDRDSYLWCVFHVFQVEVNKSLNSLKWAGLTSCTPASKLIVSWQGKSQMSLKQRGANG